MWLEGSGPLDLSKESRCRDKVEKDFVFLEFTVAKDSVDVSRMKRTYTYSDQISLIGNS